MRERERDREELHVSTHPSAQAKAKAKAKAGLGLCNNNFGFICDTVIHLFLYRLKLGILCRRKFTICVFSIYLILSNMCLRFFDRMGQLMFCSY